MLIISQKTFTRYWDFSIPSAEVRPTEISKYNTALQLLLVGVTTVGPLVPFEIALPLLGLQYVSHLQATTQAMILTCIDGQSQARRCGAG